MVLLAVVLGFYAVFFDAPAAVIAGGGLAAFLIARAFLVLSALRSMAGSLSVERSLSHRLIRQGSQLIVATRITGAPYTAFSVAFSDSIPSGSALSGGNSSCVPGEHGSCTFSYTLTPLAIGEHSFDGVMMTVSDLFFTVSLILRTAKAAEPSFTVLPSADYALKGPDVYGEAESRSLTPVVSRSIRSYREYVPGDDFRSIDWKLSAKHDTLWVREYMGRAEEADLIIIDLPDAGAPFSPEAFARLKDTAAGSVATRFRSNRPFSILLISGPNLVSFVPGQSDALKLIAMMDSLTPVPRLHHLSRYQSSAALRKRFAGLDTRNDLFAGQISRITGAFLSKRSPVPFETQLVRIFHGIRVSTAHLFSLTAHDTSHLRLIAEQGAMGAMTVHLHVPKECYGPAARSALKRCGFSSVEVV
jgi:uncharacterized protein (DUF58 family)